MKQLDQDILNYNDLQNENNTAICVMLARYINSGLANSENKLWHGHPVWFLDGNPIVGYSVQKAGVRLMFWSGKSFNDPELVGNSRFQDASVFYNSVDQINEEKLATWLKKSATIQWDYKNIVKRKGKLERLHL